MPTAGSGKDRLLLYIHVPLYRQNGALLLESQACNGLRLWAENFDHVTVMIPLFPGVPPVGWRPLTDIGPALERIRVVPMPMAYRPDHFLRRLPATRRTIRGLIAEADYLCFGLGGLFGDWGAVSCIEAHRMHRPFAVWTDRVESEVTRHEAQTGQGRARLRARLTHRPMAALERWVIRRATLGLFHGRETYDAYAPLCRNPELVHDIHIGKADHIPPERLAAKIAAAGEGPLRIAYIGRAEAMKGPDDWVDVLGHLREAGVDFRAQWLGDGSALEALRARITAAGLEDRVDTPGFATDRAAVLETFRQAHVFLFCHKTPESPRCLIEALVSATPIVGYDGAFARDLISGNGGGSLAPIGETRALADTVARLAADRPMLADLFRRAALDGASFDDEGVFRHRSALIHRFLRP